MFFSYQDEVHVIYKWDPIYICKIDYDTKQLNLVREINVPKRFQSFRGSTNGIVYDNKIWFIVHKQDSIHMKKSYVHHFVVFDTEMNLLGYSIPFKFEGKLVEYCIGMIVQDHKFIITYSTLDSTSNIVIVSPSYAKSLIIGHNS